ncbi:hypothetical protein LSH36_255g05019 [Paralvinella palmiformis]|uniref:Mediator of RNA polymerase II transcription subunit 18 n=1 Tax=Paralvinella palmiformis TaxID=53620 RepID=A0AAD9JKT7_9ANNE|nr:hypothetical protein LSH36_255g05019 [Paralvinella palmiformis]
MTNKNVEYKSQAGITAVCGILSISSRYKLSSAWLLLPGFSAYRQCGKEVPSLTHIIGITDLFRLDHEYILKGYFFRKGRMKVTVSKIFKMLELGNIDNIEPLSNSYLVELGVVAPYGQDAIQEDMRNFAEQLKPLVQLEKDHRKIQQMQR